VQAALLVSKCEAKSIPEVVEEMKVHGLLVCTHLFAQGIIDSCKDHNTEEEKVCVREKEKQSISKQYCMDLSKSIFSHLNVSSLLCSINLLIY
jgi:hypothetical protein